MNAGLNKKQKKQVEKIIYKKITWQGVLVLLIWVIVLLAAAMVERCNAAEINIDKLNEGLDKYYELVITITTILTAAVVFFYSIIDSRRLGITNRMIISYCVGSYTIPISFMFTLIHLPLIRLWLDIGWEYVAAADMAYVFILQMMIILLILISTSFHQHIKIICWIERKHLLLMLKCAEKNEESPWIFLMESVARTDSLFLDKSRMIRRLLDIPFEIKNQTGLCWEKVIYKYYYLNLVEIFRQFRDELELDKIYAILYEFAWERTRCSLGHISRRICILINSAILNAFLDNGTAGKEGFCTYFINECVEDEIRNEQIVLFYLFHELMYRESIYIIDVQTVQSLKLTGELEEEAGKVRDECLTFWEIWSDLYTISREVSAASFYNAMCTLEGKSWSSCPILYIKNLLHKER